MNCSLCFSNKPHYVHAHWVPFCGTNECYVAPTEWRNVFILARGDLIKLFVPWHGLASYMYSLCGFSQLVLLCACTCTLGGGMSSLPSDNKNKNVSVVDKTVTYEHQCFPRKMLYSKKFNTSFPSLPFPSPTLISYMSIISVCGRENYDFTKFSPEDVLVDKPSIQEAINVSPFTLPPF